ncbi:hypothetical protein Ancab_023205 [Ancistrocladus abbreviatus]
MPSPTLSRRAKPTIHQLSSIPRLYIRQLSSLPGDPQSSSSIKYLQRPKSRSILIWVTGIAVGSTFGALYYYPSSSCSDSNTNSSFSVFDSLKAKSVLAFANWPSAPTTGSATFTSVGSRHSLPRSKPKFLFGDAYRKKIFFNYEKRIRMQSPPEKVFEYFASFKNSEGEVLMTPADLMRAVVPVFPPSESNLVYLFGYTTSHSESSFSVAFKMFDIDNNGVIHKEEFKKVMGLMRAQTRQGASHCDGLRAGIKLGHSVENGGLVEYFFGKDGKTCLQHDKFVQFLRSLHDEILRLEFSHYDYMSRGSISAKDFALSVVASADIKHINKLLEQVDEIDNDANLCNIHISEDEFRKFAELRKRLQPFSLALFSYGKINGLLTKKDFQRAASQVCDVHLSENVVNIIFHVFDANRDGSLSANEFLRVLAKREMDIGRPLEDGFLGFLSCCWSCTTTNRCSISGLLL